MIRFLLLSLQILVLTVPTFSQTFNEILGRPTDQSVTLSVLFSEPVETRVNYGSAPELLDKFTDPVISQTDTPVVIVMQGLEADTRYHYRTLYRKKGGAKELQGPLRQFHTQRAPGKSFRFLVEADEHLYDKKGVPELYQICLENQARDSADFMLSLGDTFGDDHTPETTTSEDMRQLHLEYRKYLGELCHSLPFFFCLGNHEGESGYWLDQTPPDNIAVYGTLWRKFYYPNPYPDDFYSGNMTEEGYGMGQPENYYAFTWGDALFVILDVYRDCDVSEKPKNWEWTLGKTQYDWLKETLESSDATFKFVFGHHNRGQGRGGIDPARGYEWGGYGNNGSGAWEFDQERPGWDMPIHQLMVKNGVNIFFQGHDHLYAKEELDGLVYQEVPMPCDTTYQIGMLANADAYTDITLDGSGHLRVSVEPQCVTVEYIAAYRPQDTDAQHQNRMVRHSYHLGNCATATTGGDPLPAEDWQVTPNPTAGRTSLILNRTTANNWNVDILDLQGNLLASRLLPAGETRLDIDLGEMPPQMCIARMNDGRHVITKKIILAP